MTSIFLYILTINSAPCIEPEGYFIKPAFSACGIVATDDHCSALYLISDRGSGKSDLERLYSGPGCGRYFTISPDGKTIGFKLIAENGLQTPALYDLEKKTVIGLHEPANQCGQVSFSANGMMTFAIGNELIVISGNNTRRYDLGGHVNLAPASPDGKFAVYNDDHDQLWRLDLASGVRSRFTGNDTGYCHPIWSPDSRRIAFSTINGQIRVFDIASGRTYNIGDGASPAWSADGENIVFHVIETDGRSLTGSELVTTRFDGSNRKELTRTGHVFEMDPQFSSDGTKVLFQTFGARAICEGELSGRGLKDVRPVYQAPGPLTVEHFRSRPFPGARDSIDVPYYHQVYDTPSWHSGYWSCAPTTAIMAIAYYRKLPHWDCWCSSPYGHTSHFGRYICERYHYRETDYNWEALDYAGNTAWGGYGYMWYNGYSPHSRMANYINNHNLTSWTDDTPTWNETLAEVTAGYPYCICALLTSAGHLVLAVGQVLDWHTLIFNDPYGDKNQGYMNYNGKNARYDWPGYNNGYQNLSTVAWCAGARGSREPASDTIVDDLQFEDGFYLHTETPSSMAYWWDALNGFRGHMWYTYTTGGTTDTCHAVWTPVLPQSGNYEVLAYIPAVHNGAAAARYQVNHAGGTQAVIVNQADYPGSWATLGTYYFNAGAGSVRLGDATGTQGQHIAFDAMKWSWAGTGIADDIKAPPQTGRIMTAPSVVRSRLTLRLDLTAAAMVGLKIYDAGGRCVIRRDPTLMDGGSQFLRLETGGLPSGAYIIGTSVNGKTIYGRFVKI